MALSVCVLISEEGLYGSLLYIQLGKTNFFHFNRGYKQSWALEPEFKGKPVTCFVTRVLDLVFNWFASHANA